MIVQTFKRIPLFLMLCFLLPHASFAGSNEKGGNDGKQSICATNQGQIFEIKVDPVGICQQIACGDQRTQTFKEVIPNVFCRNLNQSSVENIVDQFVSQWCALELICCAPSQEICVRQCFRSSPVSWQCNNNNLTVKFSITTRCRTF